ncbi:MAG: phytoene/squalene synthase family protein [Gemmatimonadaceae bacterium]
MNDARICADIAHSHARTFVMASRLLPREKRRGTFALYAVCRTADDIVDRAKPDHPVDALRQELADFAGGIQRALQGSPRNAIERELAWASERFHVPSASIDDLLAGIATDLDVNRYRTWADLERYCRGVASSVGEMCVAVFGVAGGADAQRYATEAARTLGVAMQLTNILRDVGEDAARGRCYLPEDDLLQSGFSRDDVLHGNLLSRGTAWRTAMEHQIARARTLYGEAMPGIAFLSSDAQACATACALGYARILDAIERNDFNNVTRRARVAWPERALVLFEAWRGRQAGPPRDDLDAAVA